MHVGGAGTSLAGRGGGASEESALTSANLCLLSQKGPHPKGEEEVVARLHCGNRGEDQA